MHAADMSDIEAKGLRFRHPSLAGDQPAGLRLSNRGSLDMIAGDALVRQAIHLLLTTRRGERVMRPDFGCELDRLLFLPNDPTTAGLAIHYVGQAIQRWEPRIEILDLDAFPDPRDATRLEISLEYRVAASGTEDALNVSMSLAGEVE